ncbi:MAG: UDP-N-acetylglucosamine 2-epimerase (non-hydrolyzing) [PVC group bacterium]
MKIINIVGARPNFMKIAPLMEAYRGCPEIEPLLVHTGQHYDEEMSDLFFRELGIPRPDINLEIGSSTHARQTAEIMKAFEPLLVERKPDLVLVVGDVNSTIACGLVAVKLGVRLAHVEAGLRSFDRTMPEEINRVLTDAISDLLFCTEQSGVDNLLAEGVAREKIFLVGNVMIDTLLRNRERAETSTILEKYGLTPGEYAVMTLHRPSNVDDPETFGGIIDALEVIQKDMPVIFPVHPRTRKTIDRVLPPARLFALPGLRLIDPAGYLDFLKLMADARLVLTDSGGIQEETTILKVPCLTIRKNTERPVTCEIGTNHLAGVTTETILAAYREFASGDRKPGDAPPLWDGKAAGRIVEILLRGRGLTG